MLDSKLVVGLAALTVAAAAGATVGLRSAHRAHNEACCPAACQRADEDGDVQVSLEQCPEAVQATIREHVGSGSINEIERSPAGNFEVDATGPGGDFEFVVAGNGNYLGPEDDDDGDDGDDD